MKRLLYCMSEILSFLYLLFSLTVMTPILIGWKYYVVTSGSMAPSIPVGSVVFIKNCEIRTLQEGDVITYKLPDGKTAVTHRVMSVDKANGWVRTQGDANEREDDLSVTQERLVGKVVLTLRGFGALLLFLGTVRGKLCACALGAVVWILSALASDLTDRKDQPSCLSLQ